jgi:hypothetical protein
MIGDLLGGTEENHQISFHVPVVTKIIFVESMGMSAETDHYQYRCA